MSKEFLKFVPFVPILNELRYIADTETEGEDKKDNVDSEEDTDEYLSKQSGKCPRCGQSWNECTCQEEDSMDTISAHRFHGEIKTKK